MSLHVTARSLLQCHSEVLNMPKWIYIRATLNHNELPFCDMQQFSSDPEVAPGTVQTSSNIQRESRLSIRNITDFMQ